MSYIAGRKPASVRSTDSCVSVLPAAAEFKNDQSLSIRRDAHVLRLPAIAGLLLFALLALFPLGIPAQQQPGSAEPPSDPLPQAPDPAQPPLNLDMASVADLARTQSWTSKQVHQDAATAAADARRVASARWGQVDFQSQYLRFKDPIHIELPIPTDLQPVLGLKSLTTPLAPQDNLHVDLQAGYSIFTGGKIDNAIKATREVSEASSEAGSCLRMGILSFQELV